MYERETGKVKPEYAELKELEPYGELGVELLEGEWNRIGEVSWPLSTEYQGEQLSPCLVQSGASCPRDSGLGLATLY